GVEVGMQDGGRAPHPTMFAQVFEDTPASRQLTGGSHRDQRPVADSRHMNSGVLVRSLAVGATGLVGWTVALAVRLPTRYTAGHWNVAWVGFDVILLVSVIATAWATAVALFRVAHRGLPQPARVPARDQRVLEELSSGR